MKKANEEIEPYGQNSTVGAALNILELTKECCIFKWNEQVLKSENVAIPSGKGGKFTIKRRNNLLEAVYCEKFYIEINNFYILLNFTFSIFHLLYSIAMIQVFHHCNSAMTLYLLKSVTRKFYLSISMAYLSFFCKCRL